MPFTFSEQHITEYYHNGYTVFQSILPSSLVQDLRRVTDLAREIIREENGPQVQRLQPVGKYADRLDMQPFQDTKNCRNLWTPVSGCSVLCISLKVKYEWASFSNRQIDPGAPYGTGISRQKRIM